uniref:Uncharacterized protein n=1 Tax=Rhizophora mucronata TaxID=61149 RepID=A0A2P2P8F7_RHIMU
MSQSSRNRNRSSELGLVVLFFFIVDLYHVILSFFDMELLLHKEVDCLHI